MKFLSLMFCLMSLSAFANERELPTQLTAERLKPLKPEWRIEICEERLCRQERLLDVVRRARQERSGGGDIIGNGGGLGEQNFIYALSQVAGFINETIAAGLVQGPDVAALTRIAWHAREQGSRAGELIFISGKAVPGLFDSPSDPEVRMAKTALSPDAPILINLDMIYQRAYGSLEIMPFTVMVASLVHELGHQIGIQDHSYLDYLGARVRRLLEREQNRVGRRLGRDGRVDMTSINLGPLALPKLYFTFGEQLLTFDRELHGALTCRDPQAQVRSARFDNQHWQPGVNFDRTWITSYRAWVILKCVGDAGEVYEEERDFALDLTVNLAGEKPEIRVVQLALYN